MKSRQVDTKLLGQSQMLYLQVKISILTTKLGLLLNLLKIKLVSNEIQIQVKIHNKVP